MITLGRRTLLAAAGAALLEVGSARAASGSIDEQGFVRIGGIDQWIAIQGQDVGKPAILYLHGGPAEAQSPFLKEFIPWERDFIVVNWDQRGSGKTYGRNGPSTPDVTPERMAADAIEVAEHIRRRLGKTKLILIGQSWGALLGVMVAKRRPDLFHAFVGTAQPVSWESTVLDGERWAHSQAAAAGDKAGLAALDEAAKLPLSDLRRVMAMGRWRMSPSDFEYLKIQADFMGPTPPTKGDAADWGSGGAFTIPKLLPFLTTFDIRALGDTFALPVVVIQGLQDHAVSFDAAKAWIDQVKAPAKAFVAIDGGHFACFTNPEGFVAALRQTVLPLANRT